MSKEFSREIHSEHPVTDYWISVTSRDLGLRRARWAEEDNNGREVPSPMGIETQQRDHFGRILRIGNAAVIGCIDAERVQGIEREEDSLLAALHDSIITMPLDLSSSEVFASDKLFNDVHSIRTSSNGYLLTSTGVDSVVELDHDGTISWSWHATQHGYDHDSFGNFRNIDLASDHRQFVYDTWINTTHVNSALEMNANTILASLFHQGVIIAVDKHTGQHREVMRNLNRPHALRRNDTDNYGFSFANTADGQLVICSWSEYGVEILDTISLPTGWLQDCLKTQFGWLAVDGENSKVLHLNHEGDIKVVDHFDDNYLLYDVAI